MSEWPLRYFVALWSDRSKPNSTARKFTGVANVLSIIEISPCSRANATAASRHPTCTSGLVIVSTRRMRVSGRAALAQVSGRCGSTRSKLQPSRPWAQLELAAEGSPVKGEATAWLLRNAAGEWGKHGIQNGLKEMGIYDPASIVVSPAPVPDPPRGTKLPPVAEILEMKGDPARGKAAAARCMLCHRIDGSGADYGPELKSWGATQTRQVIVRAIAEPSAEIALGYQGTEVVLKDGGVIHGITFNNSDLAIKGALPLVIQSAGGVTQLVPGERIKTKRRLKRSLMYDPATLGLNAQDIADIAAWLQGDR